MFARFSFRSGVPYLKSVPTELYFGRVAVFGILASWLERRTCNCLDHRIRCAASMCCLRYCADSRASDGRSLERRGLGYGNLVTVRKVAFGEQVLLAYYATPKEGLNDQV